MTHALDQVESCTKDQEIFSIPAFMRVQFREAWTHFAEKSLSEEESIEGSGAKKLNDLKIFFQTWPYWYYYLKKVRDQDGKRKHIQMETLSSRHDFVDCTLVPAVQPKLS